MIDNKEKTELLSGLRNQHEMPIDEDEYYLLEEIADHLIGDVNTEPAEPIFKICSFCGKKVKWDDR